MEAFFVGVEQSALSTWLRESLSIFAFPTVLTLHTVGLAFLVGPNTALDLRLLGVAPTLPVAPMQRLFPVMWAGLWISVVTGVALVVAYPAKALTNPLFYVKLAFVALALVVLRRLHSRVFDGSGVPKGEGNTPRVRLLAASSLGLWLAAIFAGRWLAYTYTRLLAYAGL